MKTFDIATQNYHKKKAQNRARIAPQMRKQDAGLRRTLRWRVVRNTFIDAIDRSFKKAFGS